MLYPSNQAAFGGATLSPAEGRIAPPTLMPAGFTMNSQYRMMGMAQQMRAAQLLNPASFLLYRPNFMIPQQQRRGSETSSFPSSGSSASSLVHPASTCGGNSLSPGGSESSGSQCGGASSSPPSSVSSAKLFRPWLSNEDEKLKTPKKEPLVLSPRHKPRVSGSRNDRVVPVEETPLLKHQSALEAIATNLGKSGLGHRCIYCAKVYSRKYGLKIHLRTHTGFKPLKCRICQRAFGDPSNLNKHTRLHEEGGSAWRCVPCQKVLLRRRDLDRHLAATHGAQPCDALPPFVQHQSLPSFSPLTPSL